MAESVSTGANKTIVLTAAIAALPPTIAAVASLIVSLGVHTKVEETKAAVAETAAKVEVVQKQTDGMQKALTAAALKVGKAEGEKAGVQKGVAVEKARTAAAQENQAKGAAIEKAKPFWKK